MPNHVKNILEFDCSKNICLEIASWIRADDEPLGSIDFNKIIPMPECLKIPCGSIGENALGLYKLYIANNSGLTMEEFANMHDISIEDFYLGKNYYDNQTNYGATTWYDWSVSNWGTKWNAYDSVPIEYGDKAITFCTAWSCAMPVIKQMSEIFNMIPMTYSWADEDMGFNVGKVELYNGKITHSYIPEGGSKEAYELAASILDVAIEDVMVFDDVTGTYVWKE